LQAAAELLKWQGGKTVVQVVEESLPGNSDEFSSTAFWRCSEEVIAILVGPKERPVAAPSTLRRDPLTAFRGEPLEFLRGPDRPIDLLHLDGWAIGTTDYKQRHLDAYRAARDKLHERSLILIGQTQSDHGGKATLVLPEALADGFHVYLWGEMTLLGREPLAAVRSLLPRIGPPVPEEASFDDAVCLHRQGQQWEAEQIYRHILTRQPRHAAALHLLGVVHYQHGDADAALDFIGRAIALVPDKPAYHNNYGAALHVLGRHAEALDCFQRALELNPRYPDALANLGMAQTAMGHPHAAIATCCEALLIQPSHRDAMTRLRSALQQAGRDREAGNLSELAKAERPGAEFYARLGNLMFGSGRAEAATAAYRKAIELAPDHAAAHFNLGSACQEVYCIEEARHHLQRAAELRPEEPFWRLRALLAGPVVFQDAAEVDAYRQNLLRTLDAWSAAAPATAEWDRLLTAAVHPALSLSYHGRNNRQLKERFAAIFGRYLVDQPEPSGSGLPDRRRIGFLVTRRHEAMFLRSMGGILENLDGERFELVVLCCRRIVETLRRGLHRDDLRFVPFDDSLPTAVRKIREAACDLIYYWEVGSDAMNYFLPFAHLAPVQCTGWGSALTSGVPAIDYFLSSELIERPGSDVQYSERLWLSKTLFVNKSRLPPVAPVSRGQFGLPDDRNLYVCLQNPLKLHPDFDPLLAGILASDPRALIVLLADRAGHVADRLWQRFVHRVPGAAGRIVFLPQQPLDDYCRLLQLADVVLDPPHYGAGSSCYDIFSFNQPLVTLPGELIVGRITQAFYKKMQFEELIVRSPTEYVAKAVQVATDRDYRAHVKDRIARSSDVVFDDIEAVREHERFFDEVLADAARRR